jgi:hypothetical protein
MRRTKRVDHDTNLSLCRIKRIAETLAPQVIGRLNDAVDNAPDAHLIAQVRDGSVGFPT